MFDEARDCVGAGTSERVEISKKAWRDARVRFCTGGTEPRSQDIMRDSAERECARLRAHALARALERTRPRTRTAWRGRRNVDGVTWTAWRERRGVGGRVRRRECTCTHARVGARACARVRVCESGAPYCSADCSAPLETKKPLALSSGSPSVSSSCNRRKHVRTHNSAKSQQRGASAAESTRCADRGSHGSSARAARELGVERAAPCGEEGRCAMRRQRPSEKALPRQPPAATRLLGRIPSSPQ
eukprot:5706609-Pleurochrysis_carterae.AAC.2